MMNCLNKVRCLPVEVNFYLCQGGYVLCSICLSVCLFLRAAACTNCQSDLCENFITDVSVDEGEFWKASCLDLDVGILSEHSSQLQDGAFFHNLMHGLGKPTRTS